MKKVRRLLSILLLCSMLLPMLPTTAVSAFAASLGGEDAMQAIKSDTSLEAYRRGETQRYDNDGYIGIPYEVTVYYDYATYGRAKAGYMTVGATPVMMYVVNANFERIGTDSDTDIIKSMLSRGCVVVVVDYLNNAKAQSPDLDWSSQKLRTKAKSGEFFKDSTVFESGTYDDTLTVPSGYNVRLNDVYFELDKHGVDGTLEEIVKNWNNDFRGVRASKIVKWVHEDGTRKPTQTGIDGSSPVWYADAAGKTVDNASGQYIKVTHTKATSITDCVKPDGTPIDLNLYMHTVYPTHPEKEVPAVILYSSSASLAAALNKEDRPQFAGFLFNGYAGAIADYAYIPMGRSDHNYGGTHSGDTTGGVTGVNMTYATYTYNATQSATAAVRMLRYFALSEDYSIDIDVDHVGAYGISKTAWYTQLGAPVLRNDLITKADGFTDLEVAQHVNDKINNFVQLLLPTQSSGRSRYDNGKTESYTVDGFTVDGGELQPFAVYDGAEISSGVQANYSSCGAFLDYFEKGYAPQFITENLADTSNTEYGQQNIMVNLCRTMDIPALWFEADIPHTFAQGVDHNHGVDTYAAFFKFMGYYLKNEPVSVCYTDPSNGAVLGTTDGITVKFVGEVSAAEIEKVIITDEAGNALTGSWTSAYGNTEWTFTADNMKGTTAYTLTVPADVKGENGKAMGNAYIASFYTRSEGDVTAIGGAATVDENGKTVTLTVPSKTADGFLLRVNVKNDAANTLSAYNAANGDLMGSVRISGAGYHEIDVTDYLAAYAEGTEIAVTLKTAKAEMHEAHYSSSFDSDSGHLGFRESEITVGQEIDGALALKVVRTTNDGKGEYSVYSNMENAYTFSTNKLIKNGSAVSKADLGRTFLITLRVYDTVSRPIHMYMNSGTQRTTGRIDHDRVYYNFFTKANEWCEFTIPYTVYEMKYSWNTQVKDLFVQFTPLGGNDKNPIYIDHLSVVEVFTDINVSSVSLVSTKDSGLGVKTPESTKPFKVGSAEYTTWKAAINAAASGATVKMQSNYTLNSGDLVSFAAKTDLVIDLGGYRLTAANSYDAPLWASATNANTLNVTLKNGSVVLADTPLIGYGSSTAAGSGKVVNVSLENLYITVAENATTLNIVSNRTTSNAKGLVSNISLTDCVLDVERDHLPEKRLSGLEYFPVGDAAISVKYTVTGGKMILDSVRDAEFCKGIIEVKPNANGEYLQVLMHNGEKVPSVTFKKGSDYAVLKQTSTENGYAVYSVEKSEYSTDYGAIPNEYTDVSKYPFVIFMDEAFIGAGNWKTTNETVKAALANKPGATVNVLLRTNYTSETYIGNANWLCFMNGTFNLDLGGNVITSEQSLFEAGVDSSYTGTYDTVFTVKNGTVLVGGGNMCGAQQSSSYNKRMDITFENVTFGLAETFATKRNKLFYGSNNSTAKGVLDVNITITDCTFDLRGIPCAYTVFAYGNTANSVAADIKVIGGKILTDSTVGNITWYTEDTSGAVDTVLFEKGEDGKYITMSVVNGTTPTAAFPTADGVFSFGELVSDGAEYDVYTLKNDSIPSPYGAIPAAYANNTFVIFTNGYAIGAKDTWKDSLTLARESLNANPGGAVQILMQKDRAVTSYVGSSNWLCYMNGAILLDLNGHTLTAKTTSLFEAGVDGSYTGSYKTALTVKNGTVLQGNGNVCGIQNNAAGYDKVFELSFENVDFAIDPQSFDGSKRKQLFYAQTNCKADVDVTLTLTDCDIDMSGITTAYTIFSFASSDTRVSADLTFNGGSVKVDSFDNITFLTLDKSNDTFVWGKGSDGEYATLTLPTAATLPTISGLNTEGVYVSFGGNGVTSGDCTTYSLVENPLVSKYGTIPESAADIDANPFVLFDANGNYIGANAAWGNAITAAKNYLLSNMGKTVYVVMRADQDAASSSAPSLGDVLGTIKVDLCGFTLKRGNNSVLEANTAANLNATKSAYEANVLIFNGRILAGRTTTNKNGHLITYQRKSNLNKTINITFENVEFGIRSETTGLSSLLVRAWGDDTATGLITSNLILKDCSFDFTGSAGTAVLSTTLIHISDAGTGANVSVVLEGGSFKGNAAGVTFASIDGTDTVKLTKNEDGKYFYFDLTAGTPPTDTFASDIGTVSFVKTSNGIYTVAVKASELGNAVIPYEQYEDVKNYPFIVYVEGKLISASTGWKQAQESAQKYLESNNGATVYVKMRRDVENVEWFKSAGVFNGTVILDLGGFALSRRDNSFMELCTNGLTAEQCTFLSTVIVKNGTLLAAKTANDNGHVVAVQSNGAYNKSFNITFENVTFGISKLNYSAEKGLYAVALRDNGATAGATGKVSVDLLLKNCTFLFTDSDETVIPTKDTTVIYTKPGTAPNNLNITVEGGVFQGSHSKVTFINAGSGTSVLYTPNDEGEYFRYELTAGVPSAGIVNTDRGEALFVASGNGVYLLTARAEFTGASVDLGKDLSVLYCVKIGDPSLLTEAAPSVRFTMNGTTVTVTEYQILNGEYVFTLSGIAPQQIGDTVDAELLIGENVIATHKGYSIKKNAQNLLSKGAAALGMSDAKFAALKTLLSDLLLYGEAAQNYVGYETSSPVTEGIEWLAGSAVTPDESDAMTLTPVLSEPYFGGATVRFDTDNDIVIKIVSLLGGDVTLTVDGTVYRLDELTKKGESIYEFRIEGIAASDLGELHTFTLARDGETASVLTYGINAYVYAMTEGGETDSESMKDLALALYRYGVSASAYLSA